MTPAKPQVVIAGASGFVGTHLRRRFQDRYHWRALTRSAIRATGVIDADGTEWRQCDLYSLPQVEQAMIGASVAIYLVHSMLPSTRLVQGRFEDMDLLLADNFVRAAESAGVRHILYLGGLVPDVPEDRMSPHLASRLEVEKILASRKVPRTSLRAGLIFGPGGSSTRMLINLVHRLPVMLLPSWSRSRLQTIDIEDVLRAFEICLEDESLQGGTYDIASHELQTYRELIQRTATLLGKRPVTIDFPFQFFSISCLWVALFGGVSRQLVRPLLESLKHDLSAKPNPLQARLSGRTVPFAESIRKSVGPDQRPVAGPRSETQPVENRLIKQARKVRSVQRLPLPWNWTAADVAESYGTWLTRTFHQLIQVKQETGGILRFYWGWPRLKILELTPTPYSATLPQRRAFYITGGILTRQVDPPGRFEFRSFPERRCVIAAVHGYAPRLPWAVYHFTQAVVHLLVMKAFGRFLQQQDRTGAL